MYIYLGNEYFNKLDYANAVEQYKLALSDSVARSAVTYPYETQVSNQKLSKTKIQLIIPLHSGLGQGLCMCPNAHIAM